MSSQAVAGPLPEPLSKYNPKTAVQAVVPVAICFATGLLTHQEAAGTIAASGAFTVGFAPFNALSESPAFSMLITSFAIGISATLGNLCGLHPATLYAGTMIWAVAAGLCVAMGKHLTWVGTQTAIYFMVSAYFSKGYSHALDRGWLLAAGGLIQWLLFAARWNWIGHASEKIWIRSQLREQVRTHLKAFQTEVKWNSPYAFYATRVAVALVLSTFLYRHFDIKNGYWIPMTAILVMKPNWAETKNRGIARVLGTMAGGILASLLIHSVKPEPEVLSVLAIAFAWGCYTLQNANYAIFSTSLTAYIVFLLALGGFSEQKAIDLRVLCTLAGGVIGMSMDLIAKAFNIRIHQA